MVLREIYILVLKQFAYSQQVLISVFYTLSVILSLEFPIPTVFSKLPLVLYASDKIWLLGKNNMSTFRPVAILSFAIRGRDNVLLRKVQ